MKKIKRFVLLLIMAFLAVNVQAQLEQAVKNIFAGDTLLPNQDAPSQPHQYCRR